MNKEENNNHILIEVLNNDGDLKLTKFRNPQAIWQNNEYPDEYVFRDVDYVNIFQLQQENKQLKDNWNKLKEFVGYENISKLIDRGYNVNDIVDEIRWKIEELENGD